MSDFKPHRNFHKNRYTSIPNELIRSGLGNSAFRLLCYLASNSENWKVFQSVVMKELGWGRDMIRGAINELVDKKYMIVTQERNENGHFKNNLYEFDFEPIIDSNNEYQGGKPDIGKTDVGEPPSTSILTNTNKINEEPNLTNLEERSSQVSKYEEKLKKLPMIERENGNETTTFFSSSEIEWIISKYTDEQIEKAAKNVSIRKTRNRASIGHIQSEKSYFLSSLKGIKSGKYDICTISTKNMQNMQNREVYG